MILSEDLNPKCVQHNRMRGTFAENSWLVRWRSGSLTSGIPGCYTSSTRSGSPFCGEDDSKSEKAGSSFATHDGAPLVTASPTSSLLGRERLRSAATMNYDIERTKLKFGESSFAVSGPTAWNTLPADLKCIGNISLRLVKGFISHRLHTGACVNLVLLTYLLLSFKRNLKTHLFSIAYTCKQ